MTKTRFADIILPLAVRGRFTYRIPDDILETVKPGVRVKVQFGGKKFCSGIVCNIHEKPPAVKNVKSIIDVLDAVPAVNETQLKLWLWISVYYLCSEGEVVKAALPSEICLNNYKPRLETFIELAGRFTGKELNTILDNLARAPRQQEVLSTYIRLTGYTFGSEIIPIRKSLLLSEAQSSPNIIEALTGKGILSAVSHTVSRLSESDSYKDPIKKLSEAQSVAYESITSQLKEKDIVLLHGVTSSGKTEIYIHLIYTSDAA